MQSASVVHACVVGWRGHTLAEARWFAGSGGGQETLPPPPLPVCEEQPAAPIIPTATQLAQALVLMRQSEAMDVPRERPRKARTVAGCV